LWAPPVIDFSLLEFKGLMFFWKVAIFFFLVFIIKMFSIFKNSSVRSIEQLKDTGTHCTIRAVNKKVIESKCALIAQRTFVVKRIYGE